MAVLTDDKVIAAKILPLFGELDITEDTESLETGLKIYEEAPGTGCQHQCQRRKAVSRCHCRETGPGSSHTQQQGGKSVWVWPHPSWVPSLYYNVLFFPRVSWQRSKERGLSHREALFSMLRRGLPHNDLDRGWEASRAKEKWICAGIAWGFRELGVGRLMRNAWGMLESLSLRH